LDGQFQRAVLGRTGLLAEPGRTGFLLVRQARRSSLMGFRPKLGLLSLWPEVGLSVLMVSDRPLVDGDGRLIIEVNPAVVGWECLPSVLGHHWGRLY